MRWLLDRLELYIYIYVYIPVIRGKLGLNPVQGSSAVFSLEMADCFECLSTYFALLCSNTLGRRVFNKTLMLLWRRIQTS